MTYDKSKLQVLLAAERTKENMNELIKINEGLIFAQLKKFGLYNDTEAISLGYEALFSAVRTFDTNRAAAFSTYATVCIYNRLGSYVRSLKAAPQLVQLTELNHVTVLDEIGYIQSDTVDYIHSVVYLLHQTVKQPLSCKVLDIWITSCYTESSVSIASKVGCSQPYVSKIINSFRKRLNHKLEGKL